MKTKNLLLLVCLCLTFQVVSQDQSGLALSKHRTQNLSINKNNNETSDKMPNKLFGSVFVRTPNIIDYDFKTKHTFYTPALMGGFGLLYGKLYFELGALIDKTDHYGLSSNLIYSLWGKQLDESWSSTTGILGEAAYFPAQETYDDLWIYTVGICHLIYLPRKWGTPSIGFLFGTGYMMDSFHLHGRVMLNLSLPVF